MNFKIYICYFNNIYVLKNICMNVYNMNIL